jgi:hypothetical protein
MGAAAEVAMPDNVRAALCDTSSLCDRLFPVIAAQLADPPRFGRSMRSCRADAQPS